MSIQLKVKSGTYPDFAIKLDHFPSTTELDQDKGLHTLLGLVVISVLLMLFAGFSIFLFFIVAAGLFIFFRHGTEGLFAPNTLTFGHNKVSVSEFSLWKRKEWSAPYGSFEGVYLYQIAEKDDHGKYIDYRTIELKHQDSEKTLPLFAKRSDKKHHKDLRFYANRFNLPAFD